MDLLGMKKLLVQTSGHEELVADAENGNWADPSDVRIMSATTALNTAMNFLDRHLPYHKTDAILYKRVLPGVATVDFRRARWVKEVWVVDSEGVRYELEKLTHKVMRTLYPDAVLSEIEDGDPVYYSPNVSVFANNFTYTTPFVMQPTVDGFGYVSDNIVMLVSAGHGLSTGDRILLTDITDGPVELNNRIFTITDVDGFSMFLDDTYPSAIAYPVADIQPTVRLIEGIPEGMEDTDLMQWDKQESYLSKSIIIMPPPDRAITLEILGAWKNNRLTADTDFNWWSLEEPELVCRAARMYIERDLHRNETGDRHLSAAIEQELRLIHHEMIAEEQQVSSQDQLRQEWPIL